MERSLALPSLALVLLAAACSRPLVERQRMPDGSFEFRCREELWRCLIDADVVCKGDSYEVLYASDERKLYGASESQVPSYESRATVRCLKRGEELPEAPELAGSDEPVPAPPKPSERKTVPPLAAPASACVPGATQACVGAAACSGGQACLADGSGYGPCDCGPAASAPAASD